MWITARPLTSQSSVLAKDKICLMKLNSPWFHHPIHLVRLVSVQTYFLLGIAPGSKPSDDILLALWVLLSPHTFTFAGICRARLLHDFLEKFGKPS